MFVLPTTIAVLVAFLAITAYRRIQYIFAKGQSRGKAIGQPRSPRWTSAFLDTRVKLPTTQGPESSVPENEGTGAEDDELHSLRELYHKLHNLEDYPGILTHCRELLVALFSETLSTARNDPRGSILTVDEFSRNGLSAFLKAKDADVANRWEDYLNRRRSGSPREVFSDENEAKWWLKQAAPVKFADGAWLGHINKASTPFHLRKITKNAWQVMSEELGDGDLAKNHVYVYQNLLRDLEMELPAADTADFVHPRHGLDELRCWKAAVAQLLVSLFPHEYLPEALGFNMAYESLPLHLLKTVKELGELRINSYYFQLHISIDNAHSGHAAMAMSAVADYVELIADRDGPEVAATAWKRVQAGYVLAEGLPTTPESPWSKRRGSQAEHSPRKCKEAAMLKIFAAKAAVAHKIHCNSRLKIGRHTLVDWLEPKAFADHHWRRDFMHDLEDCKPWVVKGDSGKSKLVQEISWEGRMFGSFTQAEVDVVKAWIDSLRNPKEHAKLADPQVYYNFVGTRPDSHLEGSKGNVLTTYPWFVSKINRPAWLATGSEVINRSAPSIGSCELSIKELVPIWFASTTLLESLPSVPCRVADAFGSALIRVLRAQAGFDDDGPGVAGMDEVRRTDEGRAVGIIELGLELCSLAAFEQPSTLEDAVKLGDEESQQMAEYMVEIGSRWSAYREELVGMSWGFMELHEFLSSAEWADRMLGVHARGILDNIARRERAGLEVCKGEIEQDRHRAIRFWAGVDASRRAWLRCFSI